MRHLTIATPGTTERSGRRTNPTAAADESGANDEILLMDRINAAAAQLHRLWSERAAGLRDDDPSWSAQVRALDAETSSAYETLRQLLARSAATSMKPQHNPTRHTGKSVPSRLKFGTAEARSP